MKEKLKDLLDLNNSFYTFCKKIGWVFLMNLLFIITSIPVITIGASATAMYTVFNKMIDEREFSFFGDYFRAFRDNFLISTAVWLPELLITVALFRCIWNHYAYRDGSAAHCKCPDCKYAFSTDCKI